MLSQNSRNVIVNFSNHRSLRWSVYLTVLVVSVGLFWRPAHAVQIPVSVTKFTNKATRADGEGNPCPQRILWDTRLGAAFQERLIDILTNDGRLDVLERETIREIHEGEIELVNSEKEQTIERGRFQKARFTFVGSVTSYEACEGKVGVGLNVGRLFGIGDVGVGLVKSSASIDVLIRVVDTRTGRILASAKGEGRQSKTGAALAGRFDEVDFSSNTFSNSSLGKAIDESIRKSAETLLAKAPFGLKGQEVAVSPKEK